MYHKPKLILALFFFICAILSILLWINVMNVSAQNYCTGFEEVHSIEIYGDMEHFNLNDNIDMAEAVLARIDANNNMIAEYKEDNDD